MPMSDAVVKSLPKYDLKDEVYIPLDRYENIKLNSDDPKRDTKYIVVGIERRANQSGWQVAINSPDTTFSTYMDSSWFELYSNRKAPFAPKFNPGERVAIKSTYRLFYPDYMFYGIFTVVFTNENGIVYLHGNTMKVNENHLFMVNEPKE